jgi:hypothetical protein
MPEISLKKEGWETEEVEKGFVLHIHRHLHIGKATSRILSQGA